MSSNLNDLIRFESAHSSLAFRAAVYDKEALGRAIIDCMALANADGEARRYLFLGVDDGPDGKRRLVGVDRHDLARFERRLRALVSRTIDPAPSIRVGCVEVDDRLIGYVRIKDCVARPYLLKRALGAAHPAGVGYIRRGTKILPLKRADLERMFARSQRRPVAAPTIRVGFHESDLSERLTLPALPLNKLPSQLAAERLKSIMAAQNQARDVFGKTETRFSRLMHAKLYGAEIPYERHTDDSLVAALDKIDLDYRAADEHYMYEVRTHRLNLVVTNDSDDALREARLQLRVPRLEGIGIAERIYAESPAAIVRDGYPRVTTEPQSLSVSAELGTLPGQRSVRAFREPLRFIAREQAVDRDVRVDYELTAKDLAQPITGSLTIRIQRAALKSV